MLLKKIGISAEEMEQRFLAQGKGGIISQPEYAVPVKKTILDKISQNHEEIKKHIFDYNVYHETEITSNFIEKKYYYGMSAGWIEEGELDKKLASLVGQKESTEREIIELDIDYNKTPKIRWIKRSDKRFFIKATHEFKKYIVNEIFGWKSIERKTFRHNETVVNWYLDIYYYE